MYFFTWPYFRFVNIKPTQCSFHIYASWLKNSMDSGQHAPQEAKLAGSTKDSIKVGKNVPSNVDYVSAKSVTK